MREGITCKISLHFIIIKCHLLSNHLPLLFVELFEKLHLKSPCTYKKNPKTKQKHVTSFMLAPIL